MSREQTLSRPRHLAWILTDPLTRKLNATARLEPTRELRKLGWTVTLVAPGPGGEQSIRGVEVHCIPTPQAYFLRQLVFHLRVIRFLAREWATIDVILFLPMSALWLLPLRLVRVLSGRKRPLLVMDTRTLPMMTTWKGRLRALLYHLVNRVANCWADGQTTITQHLAKAARIPAQQLWGIWPSGVNPDTFAPAQTTRRWPSPGEPIHLVYIGLLNYERNLMALSQAVEKANAEGMAFVLSFIGDGTERADLEKFAAQTKGRVRVLPPVPHDQVPGLLAQAHVGVLPFPDEEKMRVSSFIKLFEYMAAGLPLLATRIVCHTDVVNSGDYAFWAENASMEGLLAGLRLVWHDRVSLSQMGREAATAAQAWTWQESARKLSDALKHGAAIYQ